MTFVIVALALVIGFIVGGAWPKPEQKKPEKPKPIGYNSKGRLIYEKPKNKIDVLA